MTSAAASSPHTTHTHPQAHTDNFLDLAATDDPEKHRIPDSGLQLQYGVEFHDWNSDSDQLIIGILI